ncbi:hypothetical protein Thermus77412_17610 [Thermus antranikianii]
MVRWVLAFLLESMAFERRIKDSYDQVPGTPSFLDWLKFAYRKGSAPSSLGSLKPPRTPTGLARSEAMLRKAVALDPRNPLARYLLGLTLAKEGRGMEAQSLLLEAHALYRAYGHVSHCVATILKGL